MNIHFAHFKSLVHKLNFHSATNFAMLIFANLYSNLLVNKHKEGQTKKKNKTNKNVFLTEMFGIAKLFAQYGGNTGQSKQ